MGYFGRAEKRMTEGMLGGFICGKGQKEKGTWAGFKPYVQQIRGYLANSALYNTGNLFHVSKNDYAKDVFACILGFV